MPHKFSIKYILNAWKMTEVFLISKPGKPPNEMPSYGSISLLPITTKNDKKQ